MVLGGVLEVGAEIAKERTGAAQTPVTVGDFERQARGAHPEALPPVCRLTRLDFYLIGSGFNGLPTRAATQPLVKPRKRPLLAEWSTSDSALRPRVRFALARV